MSLLNNQSQSVNVSSYHVFFVLKLLEIRDAKQAQISDNTHTVNIRLFFLMYLKLIFILVLSCASAHLCATAVADVNVGRVLIADQSTATQSTAGREALKQVFIKISGSEETVLEPTIRRAIVNYEQYLISSSFVQRQDILMFEARFNQEKIITLLKATGLPIWASLRPNATLWLAEQNQLSNIRWLNQNTAREFNQHLQQLAFERGVNIVLPLGDLNDAMVISDFDVWTQNTAKLMPQSNRYGTVFTISATLKPITENMRTQYQEEAMFLEQQRALERLFNPALVESSPANNSPQALSAIDENARFQIDWIFSNAKEVHIGKGFLADDKGAAALLVKEYADMLARQYAFGGDSTVGDARLHKLTMQNVRSLTDYNQVIELIRTMPQVDNVELIGVNGSNAIFLITLSTNSAEFINLVVLDRRVRESVNTSLEEHNIQLMWQR
ncbi:DUF2066 domain-containing protein [Glaciecola sp. SC05]|uniref:DUF2066 domain-containing protein n=1 Tax=Glaciecola sp. SC05 TaxID=1987355 RepID=UPI0035281D22